jgi:hypothetical protein
MKRFRGLPFIGAWSILLLAGSSARADQIQWSERAVATPGTVWGENHQGQIVFTPQVRHGREGDTEIVAANLRTISTASANKPDQFINASFSLALRFHDDESGQNAEMRFNGVFNGTLAARSGHIAVDLSAATPATQSMDLGHHLYTVTLHPQDLGAPGGRYAFTASVRVQHNPEPSTLLLAAVGAPLFGLTLWRRRARNKALSLS